MVDGLRTRLRVEGTPEDPRAALRAELVTLVDPTMDRRLQVSGADGKPGVVLVVGVNGTGKTTTVGKLARILVAEGRTVTLGAADTFRAAAVDQLATWGERVGVEVVRGAEATDPASVAFDAVQHGLDRGVDTVIVDTAGRLQNKAGLMDELGKVKRVIEKQAPVTEVLLVIDATTGQNGLIQARVFSEVVDVTGVVLTKLDGSAKGGIVVVGAARARRTREAGRPRRGPRRPGAVRRRGVRRRAARLTMLVSVVLDPGHDEELRAVSLASVENQTLTDWEVVTDLARATGEYVAFLDAGDSWVPDRLERLVALRTPFVADELEGERGNGDRVVFRTPAPDMEPVRLVAQREALARPGTGRPRAARRLAAGPPDASRHRGRAGAERRRTPPVPGPPRARSGRRPATGATSCSTGTSSTGPPSRPGRRRPGSRR